MPTLRKFFERRSKRKLGILLLTLLVGLSIGAYEFWRASTESEIRSRMTFLSQADPACAYLIDDLSLGIFEGRIRSYEGEDITRTEVDDWRYVLIASASRRSYLLESGYPCKLWFSLTRTLFVFADTRPGPESESYRSIVNVVFAKYASF